MFFYLHYILLTSGLSGTSVLLGVFLRTYSDASSGEIGFLLMSFPFVSIIIKPLFCSVADRKQAHKLYLLISLQVMLAGFAPFGIIPFFPAFYFRFPRVSWYILVISCHIGLGGLGVAWSLGESLAVNMAQRTKTPYSRMRLMGTVSWGLYGYIIGQINEVPILPKFVPAFFLLYVSVITEIVLILLWNDEDFVMCDSSQSPECLEAQPKNAADGYAIKGSPISMADICCPATAIAADHSVACRDELANNVDSSPSSLGGTLRLNAKTAMALRDLVVTEDLNWRLHEISRDEQSRGGDNNHSNTLKSSLSNQTGSSVSEKRQTLPIADCEGNQNTDEAQSKDKNPQIIIFRLILGEDGRLIKYLILFTMFGLLLAPMNFVFLSLEELSHKRGYNFSQLAGSVLISQAAIETLSFLVMPWFLRQVGRSSALTFGLIIVGARYFFYANYYYSSNISPYWALVGEWGHGIAYGIFATILADVALMFANQSRLFIPELRRKGYLSAVRSGNEEKIVLEENGIKMALRATMQAVLSGFMDGLGAGVGSLVCGIITEAYSYIKLWQLFTAIASVTSLAYILTEFTRTRWSDNYKPKEGTKAFEIMSVYKNELLNQKLNKSIAMTASINSKCEKSECKKAESNKIVSNDDNTIRQKQQTNPTC